MGKINLNASLKEDSGKRSCNILRKKGMVPGIVYKGGKEGIMVIVDYKEFQKALQSGAAEHAIVTLNVEGGKGKIEKTVLVHDVQTDPVSDKVIHVDFHEISLTESIRVKVHVAVKGQHASVKEGGVLNQVLWEIEVECMAKDIPAHIDVNVDGMKIGDTVHITDIKPPAGVKLLGDPEQVVVTVTAQQKEEEPVEAGLMPGVEEPELIKKGKKEEEGAEGEEGAAAPEKKK
jgi:large subunit ribosomal protein L25